MTRGWVLWQDNGSLLTLTYLSFSLIVLMVKEVRYQIVVQEKAQPINKIYLDGTSMSPNNKTKQEVSACQNYTPI
jgi:succinate dehydrogenase hydrophobic anchor subunit